jgi:hypothetical protein
VVAGPGSGVPARLLGAATPLGEFVGELTQREAMRTSRRRRVLPSHAGFPNAVVEAMRGKAIVATDVGAIPGCWRMVAASWFHRGTWAAGALDACSMTRSFAPRWGHAPGAARWPSTPSIPSSSSI